MHRQCLLYQRLTGMPLRRIRRTQRVGAQFRACSVKQLQITALRRLANVVPR